MLRQLELASASYAAYAFVVALGLIWGSFANVCIYRWPPSDEHPKGRSVVHPGSHCMACKAPIRWYDNLPVIAWLWLRGRCRACRTKFSARYLLVELLMGALFMLAWWMLVAGTPAAWRYEAFDLRLVRFGIAAAFCFVMVVVTFIDIDHKLILRRVTVPSLIGFYVMSLTLPERHWSDGVIGAVIGYGVPWLIGEVYFRLTKRDGLGLGDADLLAVVGAALGWKGVVVSLFGGSILGSVIGIAALLAARRGKPATRPSSGAATTGADGAAADEMADEPEPPLMRTELPFGPFLAMAAVFYLFAEPWLALRIALPGAW